MADSCVFFVVWCCMCVVAVGSSSTRDDVYHQSTIVSSTNSPPKNSTSCYDVKQVYTMKNTGVLAQTIPDRKIAGDHLSICTASTTCCTNAMEQWYSEAVKKDFWSMLQSSSTELKTLLLNSASKFRENFLDMIAASRNNTNVLFSEVYKKMDTVAEAPVTQLYTDLSYYITGQNVDLNLKVSTFFDQLFPLVYHHSINPKLKDFSEDYKECLRQTQKEIRPFGDIAAKLVLQIAKSFRAARTLLEAFQLGSDVANITDHVIFSDQCTRELVKLVYCAHCAGFVRAKPCSGYCLNIVRGCLAGLAELDQAWSDYVASLERVTAGMVSIYNVEEVLSLLDTKISEAIMYAMENGPELSKRVKQACGHPRRATRELTEPDVAMPTTLQGRIVPVRVTEESLYVQLQRVVQRLAETKGRYANLADVLCSDDSWAVRKEGRCWNGEDLGEYTKTIAGVGVAAQRYNPEMQPPKHEDVMVGAISEKLQHMSKQLRESVTPDRPQSEAYMVEGSGSGGWTRTNKISGTAVDDEDYDDDDDRGSGSGDWGGTSPDDFNFESGDGRTRDVNIKGSSGSSHRNIPNVVYLIGLCFIVFTQCSRNQFQP